MTSQREAVGRFATQRIAALGRPNEAIAVAEATIE
jgi:hypothetical protein